MKHLIILITILILSGCSNTGAKFNSSSLETAPDDKALVYFYRPSGFYGRAIGFPIIANNMEIGSLDNSAYFKRLMTPATYKIHSDTGAIDRISDFTFAAGESYFVKAYVDVGMWISSIRFKEVHKGKALLEMSDTGIQIDNFIDSETIHPAGKPLTATKFKAPKPRIEAKNESSDCITQIKSSAWYSINLKDIRQNYQGEEYKQELSKLNHKIEVSCIKKGS